LSALIKLFSALIWLPFALLYLALSPFVVLYGLALCVIAWCVLAGAGPKILIVQNGIEDASGFLSRLRQQNLSDDRTLLLDYVDHRNWFWWSLTARLFWQFGPIPMPPRFTPNFLPAVLVLKKFRWPKTFSFGRHSKDCELKFDRLLAELKEN